MAVAQTSIKAYHEGLMDGTITNRYLIVLDFLKHKPEGATRREIQEGTGLDYSCVSGRCAELMAGGKIYEDGFRVNPSKCGKAGRTAAVLKVRKSLLKRLVERVVR